MLTFTSTKNIVANKRYPLHLAGMLFVGTVLGMALVKALGGQLETMWTVFGIELLMYMLLNAFSCLMVSKIGVYLRQTVLLYVLNLVLVLGVIYLFSGQDLRNYKAGFPAFEALVFCFFSSLILILLIRSVVNFLKDEN